MTVSRRRLSATSRVALVGMASVALAAAALSAPEADRDLEEIATYIGQDNEAAANRFMSAAMSAFRILLATPNIGTRVESDDPRLAGLRRRLIPRHRNYLIFYRKTGDAIEIVRILHGARDIERIFKGDD